MLRHDIDSAFGDLDRNVPWWADLPDDARLALANMCFNLGWPKLSTFKKMLAALAIKDYPRAADEALNSRWARQVGNRSTRIAALIRGCTGG